MKVKFKYIDSKRFFHKTVVEQDCLILFKKDAINLPDNQCERMCNEIIKVVKKEGLFLFVSDIVEKLGLPDEVSSILNESLYIYVVGYSPIVASEIETDGYKLLYRGKIVAEIEYSHSNSIKKYFWGLLLLMVLSVAYYFISDYYRNRANLTEYQQDCAILDSLTNYLIDSTDSSSYNYVNYIASEKLSSVETTIDSLRQYADSCFNATKDNGRYVPLVFDKSLIIDSIHNIVIEAKELEKTDIENKRRGANDTMYTQDCLLISSLKEYLEEKFSRNADFSKYVNYAQVNTTKLMLDSLSLEAVRNHTAVLDSGNYMHVFVDTTAIKAEINEIVLFAQKLLSEEKQQKKTKSSTVTSRKGSSNKGTKVRHTAPSRAKTLDSMGDRASETEKKYLEYKKRGNEAYMSYYNSSLEKYRLMAIEQYKKALSLKRDNEIIKRLNQLNK